MKKYFIIAMAVLFIFLIGAYAKLLTKQVNYQREVVASTSTILKLENIDKTKIKIVTADTDKIQVDIQGSEEDLLGIKMESDSIFAKFGFSEDWSNISGTITVPEGMLIDITLSEGRDVTIMDASGEIIVSGENSFLIDSTTLESFTVGSGGVIQLDSWGNLIVWDDENWQILSGDQEGAGGGEGGDEDELIYCGVGSQAIRNYCCVTQNQDAQVPVCDGIGYFYFDNVQRGCEFFCEEANEVDDEDCSIGGQTERDACCEKLHSGEYGGCIGTWYFNNADRDCDILCNGGGGGDDEGDGGSGGGDTGGGGGSEPSSMYDDPISNFCYTISNQEGRDECCNDALKNPLSTGPRLGFPDCIGTWDFNPDTGCAFVCADREEMNQILNEIRQGIQ